MIRSISNFPHQHFCFFCFFLPTTILYRLVKADEYVIDQDRKSTSNR